MGVFQVKKVVAVCFHEATKMALEHMGEYRLSLSQQGVQGNPDLPRLYGEARRLRDYLQRCVSAFADIVDLDFADGDQALLVGCCRRAVEAIDLRLGGEQAITAEERQWLQKKRTVLSDWTVELADKPPLLELPLPRLSPVQTEGAKALMQRLHQKLFESGHHRAVVRGAMPNVGASSPTMGVAVPSIEPIGEIDDYAPAPQLGDLPAPTPHVRTSIRALPGPDDDAPPPLLESQKLRDPRLRTLVVMDLRSYERSLVAKDYRLAVVMLASVLEAALLDHAIPRRAEFGLASTPDTWNTQDVLVKAMGENFTPKDRSLAFHLFASRNLLRPALQIVTPTVVTQASLERLQEFVHRALHAMGYASSGLAPEPKQPPMLRVDGRSIGRPQAD